MVYYKTIRCYMYGTNVFGQWSWCETTNSSKDMSESTQDTETFIGLKLLQINWSYNLIKLGDNFFVSGAWCGKTDQFLKVPLPDGYKETETNNIDDLLITGNDFKLVLISKSRNTIWLIDLKIENEMKKIDNNIEEPVDNVEKRKKKDISISKVVLVSDCCMYLTSAGHVYSGIVHPSYVDTEHCHGRICDVKCGYEHYMLLTDTGLVYTWGNGRRLQLGHGDISNLEVPTEVEALGGIKIKKIACGGWHSIALSETGDVYVWGWNDSGQLGIKCDGGQLESQILPILIDLFDSNGEQVTINIKDIACGSKHSALLLEDNSIWTTGYNKYGQLGCSEEKYPNISYFKKAFHCENDGTLMCGPWTTILIN